MTRVTRSTFHVCFTLTVGLMAVCALLIVAHPSAADAPPQEQPSNDFVLWLVFPDTAALPSPWALAAEARQAGWQARSAAVEERLAALQDQGRIASFEPLPGSVGFTIAAPAGLPPEVRGWDGVARITPPGEATAEALAAWWRQGLDSANVARSALPDGQQATALTLNLGLYSSLVSGAAPWPDPISLSLARDGDVIASSTTTPFPDGSGAYLYAVTLAGAFDVRCGGGGYYCPLTIEPGDVLQAAQGGQTYSLTVPPLTALADQGTATVYGQTSPSTTLEIYHHRHDDPGVTFQQTVTATANGDYQADFSAITSLAPRDHGHVFYTGGDGDHVYAQYNVPYLLAGIERNYSRGIVAPCTTVTTTLYEPGGAPRDQISNFSSPDGAFDAHFSQLPQAGDVLVVTAAGQTVSTTVRPLTADSDPMSNVVGGETLPGTAVTVDLYDGPMDSYPPCSSYGDPDRSLTVTATLTGSLAGLYVADFGPDGVSAGDYGVAYSTDDAGHQTYCCFAVPFLQSHLGYYFLGGQVNGTGLLTVTLWGSSGVPRDVHFIKAYGDGNFSDDDWRGDLQLLAGDYVTVTFHDGTVIGMVMPALMVDVDRENSIVYGQAPPNSSLRVGLSYVDWGRDMAGGGPSYNPPSSYAHTLWVTSTASGVYTADLNSLTTIMPGNRVTVFHVNSQGYEAYLEFDVPVGPAVRVQSGSNHVEGRLPGGPGQVSVVLRDAGGQVKSTAYGWLYSSGSFSVHLYQDGWQPAIIEAGDTVEVSTGDRLAPTPTPAPHPTPTPYPGSNDAESDDEDIFISVLVPALTVQADRAADVISGQSPPDAPLEITWHGADAWDAPYHTWTITATAAGDYSLDLSGQIDLDRGDQIEVTWTDQDDNQVWVDYHVPRIAVRLENNEAYVTGPVYAPVTLTLRSASNALLYTSTTTLGRYGGIWFDFYGRNNDQPLYLEPGQTLTADLADEELTVELPHLTAQIDPQADIVSGEAPPGAQLMVYLYNNDWGYWPVTATVSGGYSVDFDGEVDVHPNDNIDVIYLHPDGHRIILDYAVPRLSVTLGDSFLSGIAPGQGVVTVTLRDAEGGFKGSGVDMVWPGSWFYVDLADAQSEPVTVTGGDEIIVTATGGAMTYSVPSLTAVLYQQTGLLTGNAPAGLWLSAALDRAKRQVQVGPDGTFSLDWSDYSPSFGEHGNIWVTDDLGNEVRLYFTVSYHYGYNIFLPLVNRGG